MDSKKAVHAYHRNLAVLIGLILLVFALIPMVVKSPYILNIFVLVFYMSTLSMAWNLLGGMTGQNSLGHAAYMGLGAYACCLLVVKTGANPWLAAIFGMVVVGLVAGIRVLSLLYPAGSLFYARFHCFWRVHPPGHHQLRLLRKGQRRGTALWKRFLAEFPVHQQGPLLLCGNGYDDRHLSDHEKDRPLKDGFCLKDDP